MNHNEVCSKVNVPFSWELKPGVSKVTSEEGSTETRHVTVNLPPPPRLSNSAKFCVDDLQGVLPPSPCQLHSPPRSSAKRGNVNKNEDPFVAAYRKCTEYSINGNLDSGDKNYACRTRTKKKMFTCSCKYSCTVNSDSVVRASQCSKGKERKNRGKRTGDAKLTGQSGVKCNQEKIN